MAVSYREYVRGIILDVIVMVLGGGRWVCFEESFILYEILLICLSKFVIVWGLC